MKFSKTSFLWKTLHRTLGERMRDDLSNKLVHLTKGTSDDIDGNRGEALNTLTKIMISKQLKGGTGFIKGGHKCVCFSEAPISKLSYIIAKKGQNDFKYHPYGVIVDKSWLYEKGGRPVIYGPDEDYKKLPDDLKYRHVRFELSKTSNIDHTWEREWRIQEEALDITDQDVTLVVPDREVKSALVNRYAGRWHYMY